MTSSGSSSETRLLAENELQRCKEHGSGGGEGETGAASGEDSTRYPRNMVLQLQNSTLAADADRLVIDCLGHDNCHATVQRTYSTHAPLFVIFDPPPLFSLRRPCVFIKHFFL